MLAKRLMVAKGGRSLPWEGERCQSKLVVARVGWLPRDEDGCRRNAMVANKLLVANGRIWLPK